MSVCYVTRQPMNLTTAIELLEAEGCVVKLSDNNDENWVTAVDPDGNFLHLTGGSQTLVCINRALGMMTTRPTGIEDETTYVRGKAYGLSENDPTMMADLIDMAVEGEEDFEEIMSQIFPWMEEDEDEDEDEDEATS
jgi:hypothetical protein